MCTVSIQKTASSTGIASNVHCFFFRKPPRARESLQVCTDSFKKNYHEHRNRFKCAQTILRKPPRAPESLHVCTVSMTMILFRKPPRAPESLHVCTDSFRKTASSTGIASRVHCFYSENRLEHRNRFKCALFLFRKPPRAPESLQVCVVSLQKTTTNTGIASRVHCFYSENNHEHRNRFTCALSLLR